MSNKTLRNILNDLSGVAKYSETNQALISRRPEEGKNVNSQKAN